MKTTYLEKRQAIIPAGAVKVKDKQSSAVVYLYVNGGRVCAMAFDGRKFKPAFRFAFSSVAGREQYVIQYMQKVRSNEDLAKARKAKQAAPHNLEVGHVFYSSWGYEQTNVNFYQVIGLKGKKTVILRELKQVREETGYLQGTCAPALNEFCPRSKPIVRRVGADKLVKISESQLGRLWNGEPKTFTAYH